MAEGDLTFGVAIKSTGDGSVVSDAKAATTELENMKRATDDLAAASAKQASQSQATENDIMRYYTGLSVAEDNAKAKAWALANGYQEVGGVMVKAAEDAEAGMNKTAFATHRAYTEMVVLAREASRGNFSRMAGSATILAQGLSPLALGIAGVTAALALGAYAWEKMTSDVDAETEAAKENEKQINTLSMKLEDQIVLLKQRISLSGQGITGASDKEVQQMFSLEQIITRIKGDMADGVKIARDGSYLSEDLVKAQTELNRLKDDENQKQQLTNQLKAMNKPGSIGHSTESEKQLAAAKRFDDQLLEVDKDSFTKRIDEWVKYENIIEAQVKNGDAGALEAKKQHAAALDALTLGEYNKETAINEAAAKKKAAQLASQLGSENAYFARLHAMAENSDKDALTRENLRYNRELITLNAQHAKIAAAVKNDHAKALAEDAAFQQAKLDLASYHAAQTLGLKNVSGGQVADAEGHWHALSLKSSEVFFGMAKGLMNSHSHAMFEIGKASAISETVIATYSSATKAYQAMAGIPIIGPELGAIAAAAAIASGMAQVSAIRGTSFGGGASGGGSYGGANSSTNGGNATPNYPVSSATAPAAAPAPATPIQTINLTIAGALNNPAVAQNYDWFVNTVLPLAKNAKDNGHLVDFNVVMS